MMKTIRKAAKNERGTQKMENAVINQDVSVYNDGNNIYRDENRLVSNYYTKRIIELVGCRSKKCLELGLGSGATVDILSQHFDKYVVLDGDRTLIERYKKRCPDTTAEIIETYFEDYEMPGGGYDIIVLGHILEHVNDPHQILKKYTRFLLPGGKMYIAVPNAEALNRRVGYETGLLEDICKLSENDIRLGHQRYYTLETLRREIMAQDVGLRITREEGIYLKPLTTRQMKSLNLSNEIFEGFFKIGRNYPELCMALLVEVEKF